MKKREVCIMRSTRHKLKLLRSITNASMDVVSTGTSINSNRPQHHHHHTTTTNQNTQSQTHLFLRQQFSNSTRSTPQKSQHSSSTPVPLATNNLNHNNTIPLGKNNNIINNHNTKNSFHTVPAIVTSDLPIIDHTFEGCGNLVEMEVAANSDIRIKAFGICRDYLHGAWKQIDPRDLILKRVNGGLSNWLYHCSLPLNMQPLSNEPTEVLLRFYGQVHGEDALESLITESVVFTLLSERKLGPKLYGVFPGGRIEQFIPARPLLTKELRDPELSRLITQKMAQIHALNIPISKEPMWLWGTMERWMATFRENLCNVSVADARQKEIIKTFMDYNLENELLWLKRVIPCVGSPVVFSHNDFQEGNILIRPDNKIGEEKLVLIDFEYCSYNYRGFDLANHFCEWGINNNVNEYPHFLVEPSNFPTDEEKLTFIRSYLKVFKQEYKMNHAGIDEDFLQNSVLFDEDHVLKEVEAFTLCSHFFWCLWSIINAQISKIPFGFWEYGLTRLEAYLELKNKHFN